MRSIKEKFIEVLARECHLHNIPPMVWHKEEDKIDWDFIKGYIDENDYYCKMPLAAFMADVLNKLLEDLGSMTKIDTYHESVGYICERCIVHYLISEYHMPDTDWIIDWVDFFIKDGHFEEISFIPFKYLIKPYFEDTADDSNGVFDLYVSLALSWENFEVYKGADRLEITEDNFNEFLDIL